MPNGLSQEQWANAKLIYQIGMQMRMSPRDIQIALITAIQESSLRNLSGGDRDSAGLFQQRPSQGWGSFEQVTNPHYSTQKFFTELKKVGNRDSMAMWAAAQAVQRSAFPTAYKKHIGLVQDAWPELQFAAGDAPLDLDGNPYGIVTTTERRARTAGTPAEVSVDTPDAPSVLSAVENPALAAATAPTLGGPDQDITGAEQTTNVWDSIIRPMPSQEFATVFGGFQKGVDGWRNGVVQQAKEFLGVPYVWGGTSPSGFDCSGLIQFVYSKLGMELPRVSYQQANSGKRVGVNKLLPGDLVAWDNSSRNNGADHIAIYLGGGRIIEAPRPGLSVRIRDLDNGEGAYGVKLEF